MSRYAKRGGKLWIRMFPDRSITARAAETRMGVFTLTVKESVKENVPVDTESGSHKVLILLTFIWCVVHV